jgi:hypothetical protein
MATDSSAPERTIGQLVADLTRDVEGIVRSNVALAKAEVSDSAKVMGRGVGLLVGAGVLGLFGFLFLLFTAAQAIALALPLWAGYLIVAAVVLVVALVLALLGKKALDNAETSPTRAIAEGKQTLAVIKPAAKGGVDGGSHATGGSHTAAAPVPAAPTSTAPSTTSTTSTTAS